MPSPSSRTLLLFLLALTDIQSCLAAPPLAPNSTTQECSCYQAASNREALFLNHQFFDFRSLANEPFASNLTAPPPIDNSQDGGIEPLTSPFFDTGSFGDYFIPASWSTNVSEVSPVLMVNSHQNVYLTRDSLDSPVHLTLRTNRLASFQSASGLQTTETAYMHGSIRIRARVAGSPGACAGIFTYLNDEQESDIEILTRDDRSTMRATNQPGVDPNGNVIPEASTPITISQPGETANGSWTDWNDYQLNWLPGQSEWLINGVSKLNKTYGVPTEPSNIQIRIWSDGSSWPGNMTVGGLATLDIEWIDLVYNTSREAPEGTCKTIPHRHVASTTVAPHIDQEEASKEELADAGSCLGCLPHGAQFGTNDVCSNQLPFAKLKSRLKGLASASTAMALGPSSSKSYQTPVRAQGSTSAEPSVPTGRPIPGDYTGALRPQIHYSPPRGFMNDPNGMFLDPEGVYHLYYQYNPTDIVAGNQHWGHATSRDLYTWVNQPIAIYPSGAEGEGIFSGSSVIDVNNTSGFFPNQTNGVVAFYTLHTTEEETQDIAYSTDGGYTFTKYANNPVISINSKQFRDPKVIWYPTTQQWVMVIAYAQEFVIG
ncbi:MAG: hypothetical protein Q9171_006632 [Xanthocarpia ochracea]